MNTREEQIKLVKKLLKSGVSDDARMVLEKQFPEVAESEDEKIRKALIEVFEEKVKDGFEWKAGISNNAVLSWLERQKEQKPSVEEVLIKAGLKPYKDGNQWCILIGDNIQEGICGFGDAIEDALFELLKDIKEQSGVKRMRKIDYLTSLEEKEEECMTLEEAIIHCKEKACSNTQCAREHRQLAEWLQELQQYRTKMKELQQKPAEWSEEDDNALEETIHSWLHEHDCKGWDKYGNIYVSMSNLRELVKSLRPQSHWKPSEEQMKALWEVEGRMRTNKAFILSNRLASLYNDLKKLM